jgi:hypothetical protein
LSNALKKQAFIAFRLIMKPVVSLMLRCGVTWKELSELMKLSFVEIASKEYGRHYRPTNASRVAILTGLSRRDVKRARDLLAEEDPAPLEKINLASRVLTAWHQDRDFLDKRGRPKILKPTGQKGFAGLIKRYASDIPVTAMLKELKDAGAISETPAGGLKAMTRYYMPAAMDAESILRFGSVLADLANTIQRNVVGDDDDPLRFEGRAVNLMVKRSAIKTFRTYAEHRGMELLEEADQWLLDREADPGDPKAVRLGLGIYLIVDDDNGTKS